MDPQLIPIILLTALLLAGGTITYITRRDSRSHSEAERYMEQLQQTPRPADTRSATPRRAMRAETPGPAVEPSPGMPAAPLAANHLADSLNQHAAVTQDEASELLLTLRSNQQSMADPGLSTLDRVQALMASNGFAVHLRMSAEQEAAQRGGPHTAPHAERDPRDERGSL